MAYRDLKPDLFEDAWREFAVRKYSASFMVTDFVLTGLKNIYVEQLGVYGNVKRDPVARTVPVVFFALININDHDVEAVRLHNASWVSLDERPDLIFDHNNMVIRAVEHLRYKAAL